MNKVNGLSEEDVRIIKRLQGDIPINLAPYLDIAEELGIPADYLLERIKFFQARGLLKRLGAVIRHQSAGFTANAMVVWRVPLQDVGRVGALFAEQPFISHCYQRGALPDFPYTLYTMIHAKSREECMSHTETLSRLSGVSDYQTLFSLKEFKKNSMEFF